MPIDTAILEDTLESLELNSVGTDEVKGLVEQWISRSLCYCEENEEERLMEKFLHERVEWEGVRFVDIIDLIAINYLKRN